MWSMMGAQHGESLRRLQRLNPRPGRASPHAVDVGGTEAAVDEGLVALLAVPTSKESDADHAARVWPKISNARTPGTRLVRKHEVNKARRRRDGNLLPPRRSSRGQLL